MGQRAGTQRSIRGVGPAARRGSVEGRGGVRLIDRKFQAHPLRYVWQPLLAAVSIMIVLLLVGAVAHTVLIASLGASAFIVFTMPTTTAARPRYLIGGYVVGVGVGALFGLLYGHLFGAAGIRELGTREELWLVAFAGLAVGLAIFVMVITNTEHPPATGVALGLVVNQQWDWRVLAVLILAVVALAVLRSLLRPFLKNLL